MQLGVGEGKYLKYTLSPKTTNQPAVSLFSSNYDVATVDDDGYVKGVGAGSATITVRSYSGPDATCTVTVGSSAPTNIILSEYELNMSVGETKQLTYTFKPSDAESTVSWSTGNSKIATVTQKGLVTAVGAGSTTIEAQTSNGKKATAVITVTEANQIEATSIYLSETDIALQINQEKQLTYTLYPSDATSTVTWKSDDTKIVKVSSRGLITALSVGKATITAHTSNGLEASCEVTVTDAFEPPTDVIIYPTVVNAIVGESVIILGELTPSNADTTCTWTCSKSGLIQILDHTGPNIYFKTLTAGEGTLTVKTKNGLTASASIYVSEKVDANDIELSETYLTLNRNDTYKLTYALTPYNATSKVTWKSSNTAVAKVSSGLITAVAAGEAIITAKTDNGLSATCEVEVAEKEVLPTSISVSPTSATMKAGATKYLSYTLKPENATTDITWSSSNTKVATVSSYGKVTAKAAGTATITATTDNGKKSTCKITVEEDDEEDPEENATSITLSDTNLKMAVGDSYSLSYSLYPSTARNTVSWRSSNTEVATVSSAGKVRALKTGTATITVETDNLRTATCQVVVSDNSTLTNGIALTDHSLTISDVSCRQLKYTLSFDLKDTKLTWSSSDSKVATVTQTGWVTGVKKGEATITVSTGKGQTDQCLITVKTSTPISIQEFYELEPSACKLDVVTVTYAGNNYLFIKDESGAACIYSEYETFQERYATGDFIEGAKVGIIEEDNTMMNPIQLPVSIEKKKERPTVLSQPFSQSHQWGWIRYENTPARLSDGEAYIHENILLRYEPDFKYHWEVEDGAYYDITGIATFKQSNPVLWVTDVEKTTSVGIEENAAPHTQVSVTDDKLTVKTADDTDIRVFDLTGRLCGSALQTTEARFTLPASGIYIVRTSGDVRKVNVQ